MRERYRRPPEPDPARAEQYREFRLNKVIAMLDLDPQLRLAVMTDGGSLPEYLILAVALRGIAAFEMHLPQDRYDAFKLLWIINKQGGTVTE